MQPLLMILPLIPLIALLWFVISSFGERATIASQKRKVDEGQDHRVRVYRRSTPSHFFFEQAAQAAQPISGPTTVRKRNVA
jgi:hypothetical protein